jgi:DNA topoisomerase-1
MSGFARALPDIRKKIQLELRKQGWPREKVISLMLSILDQNPIRIGNKAYEIENGTFGLTTLKRKHMKVNGNEIYCQFKAKGGIYRNAQIRGRRLTRLIVECSELPGQEVFQYLDSEGKPHPIFSHDVNSYLQEISGSDYTAKDFRTWGGTVAAIEVYKDALTELESSPKRNFTNCIVKRVAERLGNTVAVCKSYYIHPIILTLAERQQLDIDDLLSKASTKNEGLQNDLNSSELIALYLIENTSTDLASLLKESLQRA